MVAVSEMPSRGLAQRYYKGGFTIRERVLGGLTLWFVLLDCSVGWFCWVVLGKSAPPIAIAH